MYSVFYKLPLEPARVIVLSVKTSHMIRIITSLLLLFSFGLAAQTITVSEDISIRNDKYYTLIGKLKNRLLIFRDKANEYEVLAFDERLRRSWEKKIEFDKKRPEVLEIIPGRHSFSIIYRFKRKGHVLTKIHRYDPAANLLDSTTLFDYGQRFTSPDPEVIFSENKSKAVIFHFERQTEVEAYAVDVNDQQLLWKRTFSLPDMIFSRKLYQPVVDDQGNLYFITEKDNKKSSRDKHRLSIYSCIGQSEAVGQIDIPLPDFLTYDIYFTFDNLHQRLMAAGFYSEKNKGRTNGHFFVKIDPANPEGFQLKSQPFDTDFAASAMGKDADGKKGINDIDIQEVALRRDGGMLIVAERNREYERRMSSVGRGYIGRDGSRYIVDYYYEDICLISLHPDGKEHWSTILHKRQYSQDDEAVFSSYFLAKTPSSLRFVFNDEIKDENTVSEYVVNSIGNSDRNSVMSTDDQKIRLRFRDAVQVASNELIVPSERRNRLRLVRVQY